MYVTARQKKKLVELVTKHPQLIACKVTQDFNYNDSQKLWQSIANECNNVPGPGARKTWRQWRKVGFYQNNLCTFYVMIEIEQAYRTRLRLMKVRLWFYHKEKVML